MGRLVRRPSSVVNPLRRSRRADELGSHTRARPARQRPTETCRRRRRVIPLSWSGGGARDPSRVVPKDARTCRFTPPTILCENDPWVETEPTPRSSSLDRAPIPGSASGRGRGDPSAVTPRDESASRVRSVARVHRPGAWPMQEPAGTGAAAGRHNPVPESAFRVVYFRGDRAEVDTRAGSSGTQFKIPRPAASEPSGLAGAPPPIRTRRGSSPRRARP